MLSEEDKKAIDESYKNATERDRKTMEVSSIDSIFDKHNFWGKNTIPQLFNLGFGETFLYQTAHWTEKNKCTVSYPKVAIHVETLPCDQTLEFRFINKPRTWMWNVEYISNPDPRWGEGKGLSSYVAERGSEIESAIPWGSSEIYIFGRWSSIPDWKQLRRAYEKTIWFYANQEQLRDRAISSLL